ncbi:MAG: type II toxin-antitoxin system RelE/ParE family toxin [Clostridia bacterium]
MSDVYTYELMPSAILDLDGIMDYITVQLCAKDSAIALLDEIEEAIVGACRFPEAAPPVNDVLLKRKGYRKLIVKNYIVFYIPDDANRKLNVMRVMYFARDYLKEL